MYAARLADYKLLEEMLDTKLLVYVTGDRRGWETQIASDVLDLFVHHLDTIGVVKKISLYLYTRGGDTLAAWSLVNLIRQFCDELQIIVPSKAHSAGTLMCLGANSIIMTKQATLGPIDPSINTPLNPQIPGSNPGAKASVSVEAIRGFFEWAKTELAIRDDESLANILIKLADMVHPLVLGQVYRAKSQIQMLARKLLTHQHISDDRLDKIISFLVSDSGSHDYTIYRREAKENLGLNVIKPTYDEYNVIKRIYDSIASELKLNEPSDQEGMLGSSNEIQYTIKRCLIESVSGGSHYFVSEGESKRITINTPGGTQFAIQDTRKFEGWRYENVPVPNFQQYSV